MATNNSSPLKSTDGKISFHSFRSNKLITKNHQSLLISHQDDRRRLGDDDSSFQFQQTAAEKEENRSKTQARKRSQEIKQQQSQRKSGGEAPKELFIEEEGKQRSYSKAKSEVIDQEERVEKNSHFGQKLRRLGTTHENNERKRNTLIIVSQDSTDSIERPLYDR